MVHSARGKWGIKANCPCASRHTKPLVRPSAPNGISQVCRTSHILFSSLLHCFNLTPCVSPQSTTNSGGVIAPATPGIGSAPKLEGETPAVKTETARTAAPSDSGGGETVGSSSSSNPTSGTSSPCSLGQPSAKEPRSSGGEGNSSALHWLADLATQKAKDDTKGEEEEREGEVSDARLQAAHSWSSCLHRSRLAPLHDESRQPAPLRPGLAQRAVQAFRLQP